MKGVQCYELFGGIALKIHTFSFSFFFFTSCRAVKILEHGMVVERCWKKDFIEWRLLMTYDLALFLRKDALIDALSSLRRLQERFLAKGKRLYMC